MAAENKKKGGRAVLVGAGCGAGLITVKGLEAVRQAEVLLYDDLIDSGILTEAAPDCERIYVGKRSGKHSESQETIQKLLAEKAAEGKRVVRLKGGDSYVFGRGGEEVLALQEAGIPYEVIPGVTSAVAVPGHAGIPVTHRGLAQSVTVITGHSAADKEENYAALAKLEGTLVFLMGLQNVPRIAEKLMRNGKAAETPAAIISRGFSAKERRISGTLADIGEKAAQAETPAILTVGPTADFHLEPTIRRPLEKISVTLVGTGHFAEKLAAMLEENGAETDRRPVLRIRPVPESVPRELEAFGWILFTSAQGVRCFFRELQERREDLRSLGGLRFACIGEGTAAELEKHGIFADFEPSEYTAAALGRELGEQLRCRDTGSGRSTDSHKRNWDAAGDRQKVLILRAEKGSPDLTKELDAAGVSYRDVVVYRTEADPSVFARPQVRTDYIVFASGAGVRNYFAENTLPEGTVPVCIGPSTEKAFRQCCGRECLTAEKHTAQGITDLILTDAAAGCREQG